MSEDDSDKKSDCTYTVAFELSPASAAMPASRTKRFKVVAVSLISGSSD